MKRGWADSLLQSGKLLRMGCVVVLCAVSAEPTRVLGQTAQAYRQQANAFAQSKSWDEAIALYRKVLELEPNDAVAHYDLALSLKYKGETKQAVEEFETAIRLKPGWCEAHFGLGATLYELHDQAEALTDLRKAVACEPTNAEAHWYLAHIYSEQNDFLGAERELTRAVALKPSAEMHFEAGEMEGQLGKLDVAAVQFREAIRLDPKMARAYVMLGITLRRQNDHKGALANFRKAVETDPSDPNAQYDLGMELKAEGDTPGAISAFRKAIELKPDFEKAHYSLGISLRSQGDTAAAHKELDELNQLHEFRTRLAQAKLLILQGVDADPVSEGH
jgi:tetratricopeptide (TPR) repeat protein